MENKDFNKQLDELLLDIILPSEEELKAETKAEKVSLALKGRTHSDETKQKWSKAKIGKKVAIETVEKSRRGLIQTRWEQTLSRLSKQDILDAQLKYGNHQTNTMNELGISFRPYQKLCKHYDIELKKSNYEKTEWARDNQSEIVNVYKYDKTKVDGKGDYIATYYSIAEASRRLEIPKCRGHIIAVLKKKRPHTNNYYFEYKK